MEGRGWAPRALRKHHGELGPEPEVCPLAGPRVTGSCATFTRERPSAHVQARPGGSGSTGAREGPPGRGFWASVCSSGKWA